MKSAPSSYIQLTLACLFAMFSMVTNADPVDEIFPKWLSNSVEGERFRIPYASNHPLNIKGTKLDRLIVLIHGAGRSKITYERVTRVAQQKGLAEKTMILAPQFLTLDDIRAFDLPDDVLFWSSGWREGHRSHRGTDEHPRRARTSSFSIVEQLVILLVSNNPSITEVVIAGHSAGGQFAQRFAAGNMLANALRKKSVSFKYAVANPSSYVYLDKKRPVAGSVDKFARPSSAQRKQCSDYNEYKFGLDDLNRYMRQTSVYKIRKQYANRVVHYLLGADDNKINHKSLSTRCESMLQGPERLSRGIAFYNYLGEFYGDEIYQQHHQAIIPNIGHTSRIFITECGLNILFGSGECEYTRR